MSTTSRVEECIVLTMFIQLLWRERFDLRNKNGNRTNWWCWFTT